MLAFQSRMLHFTFETAKASKEKLVLFSALAARSAVLFTLDQKDFFLLLNTPVYGMLVMTPKKFLIKVGLESHC